MSLRRGRSLRPLVASFKALAGTIAMERLVQVLQVEFWVHGFGVPVGGFVRGATEPTSINKINIGF